MIVDPDVEHLLIDHLAVALPASGFPDIPVSDRVPQQGVESVVLIRTGGVRRDMVTDQAQISVDVRAGTNSRAMAIAQQVRALINDLWATIVGGFQIYDVNELSGPYSNPGSSDWCRYSQTFLIQIRSKNVVQQVGGHKQP